ncbi:MAG: twin-arginine translocase subunit TatC [Bacteroidales bacterium]|nr:twin-arginine translocase subunit TatC [Bacteroidales bacterium]
MTFWDHLDELRGRLWRILLVTLAAAVACFFFKEQLFAVVLAPKPASMRLINVELTQQFLTHMRVSLWGGVLVASPYIIYQLFSFVAPGLYRAERRLALRAVGAGYLLFASGVLLNYFVVFPFTVRFLGGYQVNAEVENSITLGSYMSVLGVMSLMMGAVFELPVLCWLLAWTGLLRADFMRRCRRHAVVLILVIAAIITPTGDPITLAVVSVPIYALWELSILVVRRVERRRH